MTDIARPVAVPAGPPPAGTGPCRKVLVCMVPPPPARLASRLIQAGPPDSVRIASSAAQLSTTVRLGWPDVIVTDAITARALSALLARVGGRQLDIVTVAATHVTTLDAIINGLTRFTGVPRPVAPIRPLTKRQLQILELIHAGLTNQQIADHFTLQLDTVKTHITHLLRRFDAKSRTQLAVRAAQYGLVTGTLDHPPPLARPR